VRIEHRRTDQARQIDRLGIERKPFNVEVRRLAPAHGRAGGPHRLDGAAFRVGGLRRAPRVPWAQRVPWTVPVGMIGNAPAGRVELDAGVDADVATDIAMQVGRHLFAVERSDREGQTDIHIGEAQPREALRSRSSPGARARMILVRFASRKV
jgi:hypothetical protein